MAWERGAEGLFKLMCYPMHMSAATFPLPPSSSPLPDPGEMHFNLTENARILSSNSNW